MKTLLLAAAACAGLAIPALAQTQTPSPPTAPSTQSPAATDQAAPSQMQGSNAGATQGADPATLSRDQVQMVQQALDRDGFGAGKVDGVWGPATEAALQKFQQSKSMGSADGRLDPATLTALQLDPSQFPQQGAAAGTTGSGATNAGNARGTGGPANGGVNSSTGSGAKTP